MTIKVGDKAPDFTTVNEENESVTLSEYANKKVVLIFYPFDFSGICQGELCEIRDNYNSWIENGAIVFGISRDSRHAHAAFKKQESSKVYFVVFGHKRSKQQLSIQTPPFDEKFVINKGGCLK